MNLSDIGQWAVMWLNGENGAVTSAWAFFHTKQGAISFRTLKGGELYEKRDNGQLVRV